MADRKEFTGREWIEAVLTERVHEETGAGGECMTEGEFSNRISDIVELYLSYELARAELMHHPMNPQPYEYTKNRINQEIMDKTNLLVQGPKGGYKKENPND